MDEILAQGIKPHLIETAMVIPACPGPAKTCLTSLVAAARQRRSGVTKGKKAVTEEKRERNRLAAERYRQKGRDTIAQLQEKTQQLERENQQLRETLVSHGLLKE